MLKKYIGDKAFYAQLFKLMFPIMIQNGITNFVNMLDNIMIGTIGTAQMTGVAITNQLIFVFNLCIFGAVSGAGIFGAQYFGKKDYKGVHYTFRFKILFALILAIFSIGLFVFSGKELLLMYMQGEQGITNAQETLKFASKYLNIMLIGLIPYTIVQSYSSTLRESGNPNLAMSSGVFAVLVNLILNYILIFGKFGAPKLGVTGAAIATVISRFAELGVIVFFTHINKKKYEFIKGVYHSFYIPKKLMVQFFIKGLPLMINETLWAAGLAVINQCYSLRGLDAVAASNISQTFWNVFAIAHMAVGASIAIIIGQLLGANELEKAKKHSEKLIFTSFVIAIIISILYYFLAEIIPLAYNTEPEIRALSTILMQITAVAMPFDALAHSSYFTMRSGGKMIITFIFDSGFMWCINVSLAFILSRYTSLPFVWIFVLIHFLSVIKGICGVLVVKKGFWVKNIISE